MFEHLSERARRVVFVARLEAGQRGADAIEIEDLLAAFIIEDQGDLGKELFGDHEPLRSSSEVGLQAHQPFLSPDLASELLPRVQALCTRSQPLPRESDLPTSDSLQRIFPLAADLRDELQQSYTAPLHLLAASLGDQSSRGAQIFREAGVTHESVIKFLREGK